MDGILYTAAASLGFAMLENVLYVGTNIVTGIVRAFTAVPLHAIASGLMGYFVGRARFSRDHAPLWIVAGLALAVFIHGTYDWTLMSEGSFGVFTSNGGVALLEVIGQVAVWALVLRLARNHALKLDDTLLGPNARPLASEGAPTPYAGMPVWITAPTGERVAARLVAGQGAHFLCALADGRQVWIPWQSVAPA